MHDPGLLIARGNLYLSRALYCTYFSGIESVALIAEGRTLLIVPLMGSAGGRLIKQRNLNGDRVIAAQEFLREHGIPEEVDPDKIQVRWNARSAALAVDLAG